VNGLISHAMLKKRSCFVLKTIGNGLRIPSTLSEVWWGSIIPFFVAFNCLDVYFSFLAMCLSNLVSFLFALLCHSLLPELNLECSPGSHKQQQQFPHPRTFQWSSKRCHKAASSSLRSPLLSSCSRLSGEVLVNT
jgi:hypothetical protein